MSRQTIHNTTNIEKEKLSESKLFINNAFFLLTNGKKILSDPRMAFTPVEIYSGLIFLGQFPRPTLGAYIEWWQSCKYTSVEETDGTTSLVWKFVGSPLSGMNATLTVSPKGFVSQIHLKQFLDLWCSFREILYKYKEAPHPQNIFPLDQVIKILHSNIC